MPDFRNICFQVIICVILHFYLITCSGDIQGSTTLITTIGHKVLGNIPTDWYMMQRYQQKEDLLNFEFRKKPSKNDLVSCIDFILPSKFKSKPLAKVGMRTKPSSSSIMDDLIRLRFHEENNKQIPVSVFVYMWINPSFRGQNTGDDLLAIAIEESLRRNFKYMLLIHDDNGSGKLIDYYKARGFQEIFEFIPKGMIKKLE